MDNASRDLYRQILYLVFLWIFVAFVLVLVFVGLQFDFSFVEGLGIGAILGIMGKMLSDGWQFFFRRGGSK